MQESNGALTESVYYILLSLTTPSHGYGIMQNVEQISNGRLSIGPGTLYGAIRTLLQKNWIIEYGDQGGRKKQYTLTDTGRAALERELLRLGELYENGKQILWKGKTKYEAENQ